MLEILNSDKIFYDVVDNLTNGVIVFENDIVLYANKEFLLKFGYDEIEIKSLKVANLLKDIYIKWELNVIKNIEIKNKYGFIILIDTKAIYINHNIIALEIVCVYNELDSLVKSEAILKEAQCLSKTGHWELDVINNKLSWSDEVYRIFEIDILKDATYEAFLEAIHPEDREMVNDAYTTSLKDKKDYSIEHRLKMKDDRVKYVLENCKTKYNEIGEPLCSIGTIQDITEIKKYEERILELNSQLEKRIDERTNELKEANKKLERINKSLEIEILERIKLEEKLHEAIKTAERASQYKSEFLANMSHEIRTPINAIIGYLQLISEVNMNDKQLEYFKNTKISSTKLLKIINDILDFSKIEANIIEIENIPFDLNSVFEEIKNIVEHLVIEKKLEFKLELDKNIPSILIGDVTKLSQIIINFIYNSIKFTDNGHVKLSTVLLGKDDKFIKIRIDVEDTGIGIDKKQLGNLFKPFSQGDNSITRKYGGTGLGLSICSSYASILNGEIFVESELGIGSKFSFIGSFEYTNLKNINENGTGTVEEIVKVKFKDTKVLLVEDNEMNRQVSKELLIQMGVDVVTAENGLKAISIMKKSEVFDLIFMDIHMPILNGFDASIEIRKFNKEIPIIALTADVVKGINKKALEVGINEYLSKPINLIKLKYLMQKYLTKEKLIIEEENDVKIELAESFNSFSLLDVNTGIKRLNGKKDKYIKILEKFVENYEIDIKDILFKKNKESYLFIHSLKGVALNIGAEKIGEMAGKIQSMCDSKNIDNELFEREVNKFVGLMSELINIIKKFIYNK